MSSQDKLERVLRDIHVLISKSEAYDNEKIIIRKNDIFDLIDRLNESVYEIMDEYELTQQSRDKAIRENKKEGDKIIWDASRQAEDIYAASVMYTDEALNHLNEIVEQTGSSITKLYKDLKANMKKQHDTIKENQLELKSQLQLLVDSEKYLKLIEERNKEIEKDKKEEEEKDKTKRPKEEKEESVFSGIKPEIKINEEYFRKAGIPIEKESEEKKEEKAEEKSEEDLKKEEEKASPAEEETAVSKEGKEPEEKESEVDKEREKALRADLDAEYFQWKDDQNTKPEKPEETYVNPEPQPKLSLLDKIIGKKK